jgi:DNA ligase (NAD+)
MLGTNVNKHGKIEKNQKIKEGACIFPFKYQWKDHDKCVTTEKGDICATSVSERGTLKTYGYCKNDIKKMSKTVSKSISASVNSKDVIKIKSKDGSKNGTKKRALKSKSLSIPRVPPNTPQSLSIPPVPPNTPKSITKEPIRISSISPIISKKSPENSNIKIKSKDKVMNKELIDIMEELADIMIRQGEPFKARAYKTASETIMGIPEDITDVKQLKSKPGIGKTIMEKLEEFQKTGTLRVLERERKNPLNLFTKIYGIGPKKAKQLIDDGITTLDDLRQHESKLNDTQKIGLKYYEPLTKRIPRSEIEEYNSLLDKVFNQVAPEGSKYEIVGSYRREAKTSGDIDIIITNNQNNKEVFNLFLDKLIKDKIIIEVLTRGKTKSLTIGQLNNSSIPRRIDFLYTPPTEYAFATLYFTGSKAFNTVMRQHALKLGYTLNEHGLSVMSSGKKGEKVNIDFPTEQSIFEFLGMKYKEPKQREGYKSIELLQSNTPPKSTLDLESSSPKSISKVSGPPPVPPPSPASIKSSSSNKTMKLSPKAKKVAKSKKGNYKDHITDFKTHGLDTLKLLSEKQLATIIDEASKAYYNETPVMSDNEFDIVKEYMESKYPKNKILKQIGAPIQEKNKVKLPYNMPSMDKIKPDTDALPKWKAKYTGPYILSAKLDGISGMYSTENNEQRLYTRGNGTVGQDISHLIPYLKLPPTPNVTIRGELIMKKSTFLEKYKDKFSNSRNLVAGIVGQKKIEPEKFGDIDFVAYEVIKPSLKPSEQMDFLEKENVITVIHEEKQDIDNSMLSDILLDWRENYKYTIDGVIVTNDKIYSRTDKNPEHGFAFKMVISDQVAEAKVVNVLWSPSKDGYLKPRIQIEPVVLGGAKIEYATAFNAAFVEDNKLGIGAVVTLVRSGDVIPHIMNVVEPAEKAKMPDVAYKWNDTHVDIIMEDADQDDTVREKNMVGFFKGLEVDGLGPGNVKKIIKAGYESVAQIIGMSQEDFLKVNGFKQKMAEKVYTSIHNKINASSLPTLMAVSNIFGRGFGERKIVPILEKYPDILISTDTDEEKIIKVKSIRGIEQKTAERFVNNIPKFMEFIKVAKLEGKLKDVPDKISVDESSPLYNKSIIITGFRDKELSQILKKVGAKESSAVSKNTFAVIVKSHDEETSKVNTAKELNIPIYTVTEFKTKYNLE